MLRPGARKGATMRNIFRSGATVVARLTDGWAVGYRSEMRQMRHVAAVCDGGW